eukprot:TRINITY_DN42620_c0_g1_i1.p1 TRINITY_DN42620_c0_g1~~TRINITY_DN42620_c0_g1_i1.p1  ORF type:complete len:376 (+),score=72.21 TRINITY_DN42620_c0_g1_i1:28-1128(+)
MSKRPLDESTASCVPPLGDFKKASEVDGGGQTLKEIKGTEGIYEITGSPYGKERNGRYGWGNVFKKIPAVAKARNVHIGLSSLNAVPMPGGKASRDMKQLFSVYGRKFAALEHCATYYRLNDPPTWQAWKGMARSVGPTFKMTIKAHKQLTHEAMLLLTDEVRSHVVDFIEKVRLLGDVLGAVLVQLPPSFKKTDENLLRLKNIGSIFPKDIPFAFDFRHPSMYCQDVYDIMKENNWAMVLYHLIDSAKNFTTPFVDTSSNLVYIRLHGSVQQFSGDYGAAHLTHWAEYISQIASSHPEKQIYIFLNNNESQVAKVPSSVIDSTCLAELINEKMAKPPKTEVKTEALVEVKPEPPLKKVKVEVTVD